MRPIHFDNSYARALPQACRPWQPAPVATPKLLYLNRPLATQLGLDLENCADAELARLFSGQQAFAGAEPVALAYAGHQFGHFVPQLGDGRALLLGEIIDPAGLRHDLAFKGSGRTPFARGGDGLAAVGPMLREVLISETLHALGIPTTRALAVVATGNHITREQALPGAILTRTAASHLRVGTFEYFAARQDLASVQQLLEYSIARHAPDLRSIQPASERYAQFLAGVVSRQAALIALWMSVGFIHGVMNTDNMTISGESIDFGPCAFMEHYDPARVYSSIDRHGRYAYNQQPARAEWNLQRLAACLWPLLGENETHAQQRAADSVGRFSAEYSWQWLQRMRCKLGLENIDALAEADTHLINDWLDLLHRQQCDYTLAWRALTQWLETRTVSAAGDLSALSPLSSLSPLLQLSDYLPSGPLMTGWLARWQERCTQEDGSKPSPARWQERIKRMRAANPWLIARNQRVETALQQANEQMDLSAFHELLDALQHPWQQPGQIMPSEAAYMAKFQTYCGT